MQKKFKIVLVGDGGVGKTVFLGKYRYPCNTPFQGRYYATVGAENYKLTFPSNHGNITLECWDTAGQNKFGCGRLDYIKGADAAVVMFDVGRKQTYKNVAKWIEDVRSVCGEIPMVLCGNKVDCGSIMVDARKITIHRKYGFQYYDISAKTNYNHDKPFLYLARVLVGKKDLVFVGSQE